MPNPYGAPELSVQEVAQKRAAGIPIVLLDVRELHEIPKANLGDGVAVAPLSQLAAQQLKALPASAADQGAEIIAFCHHGVRSAQVTAWLLQQGWTNVRSMAGGIAAYAKEIDPAVGTY